MWMIWNDNANEWFVVARRGYNGDFDATMRIIMITDVSECSCVNRSCCCYINSTIAIDWFTHAITPASSVWRRWEAPRVWVSIRLRWKGWAWAATHPPPQTGTGASSWPKRFWSPECRTFALQPNRLIFFFTFSNSIPILNFCKWFIFDIPMQLRGPALNGMKAYGWRPMLFSGRNRSGLKASGSG